MELSKELLAKAKEAKSAEEVLTLAKENNIPLTEEEANDYFTRLHAEGELSESELDNVSGGCGSGPKHLNIDNAYPRCPVCNSHITAIKSWYDGTAKYDIFSCDNYMCNKEYRHYIEGDYWTKN